MIWGTFTDVHLATLAFALLFIVILYNVLQKKSRSGQILALFVLSFIPIGGVAYNLFTSEDMMAALPLEFWSISALLLPVAILMRTKGICNMLLLWPVQSLLLLVFNQENAHLDVLSLDFFVYFFTHLLTFAIPLIIFWLKLARRDQKYLTQSIVATVLVYTGVHFINVALGTNYLYSMSPDGNELLAFFYTFLSDYWYMYCMIPPLLIYLVWWYLPEILDHRRKTKRMRMKLRDIDKYYEEYEDEYIDEIIEEKYG